MADQGDGGTSEFETVSDPVQAQAATPPAIMPYDGDAPSDRLRPKWLVLAIVAAVATVVVAGLVGWPMLENHRYNSATVWKKCSCCF